MRAVEEWIGKTDDTAIPRRVRHRVYVKYNGLCPKCGRAMRAGHWACDHIIALINGGENRESNLQPLCSSPCHWSKTRKDVAEKSHTARIRQREAGIRKPRTMTRWRTFSGQLVIAPRER